MTNRIAKSLVWPLAAAAATVAFSTEARADVQAAVVTRVTPVSAQGGWAVWSAYDEAGRYVLMARDPAGTVARLPVRSRAIPFDVDLGLDAHHGLVASYSRCRREPHAVREATTYLPEWIQGSGCDLYEYLFATHREQKLTSVSTSHASEVLPSISGSRVAFVRVGRGRHGKGYVPELRVGHLGRRQRTSRVRGGPVTGDGLPGPTGLDLSGTKLAFTWGWRRSGVITSSEVTVDDINGGHRVLQRLSHGTESSVELHSPSLSGGYVYYSEEGYDHPNALHRANLQSGHLEQAPAPLYVVGMSQDGDSTVIDNAPGNPAYGASRHCVGYHTPTLTVGQTQSSGCEIVIEQDVPFT